MRVEEILDGPGAGLPVGTKIRARARVRLGPLKPEEVVVQLYLGRLDSAGEIANPELTEMRPTGGDGRGSWIFETSEAVCREGGLHGDSVRVLPRNEALASPFLPGLIAWAGG